MSVGEADTVLGEPVDIRGFHLRAVVAFQVSISQVIRIDEQYVWRSRWNIQGEASNNEQVKIKRKSFEMSCISVFCKMWKMQTTTEY